MKNYIYILFIFLFANSILHAQTFILYGDKTYGGDSRESYPNIQYAGNNQFVIIGSSETNVNGDKSDPLCNTFPYAKDNWIIKIDTGMNIIWEQDIGSSSSAVVQPILSFIDRPDQIIFSTGARGDSACEKSEISRDSNGVYGDYWICSLDSAGNKTWEKTIGGDYVDRYPQIIRLSTGDYIICGETISDSATGEKTVKNYGGIDYWVIKLDSTRHKLWDKVYGGSGSESAGYSSLSYRHSLLRGNEGRFILAGTTSSPMSGTISDTSRGTSDIWIISLDSAGNKIWDRRYGGNGGEVVSCINHTDDGGYILCGYTTSDKGLDVTQEPVGNVDAWVIKLDSMGKKQWDRRFGGNKGIFPYYNTGANWVEQAPGGGYWVSATTNADSFDISEPPFGTTYFGRYDYWIFKLDSAGNKIFDKRFGGPGNDYTSNFIIMPDSSIYLIGIGDSGTSAVKTDAGKGAGDYWLVHFKYSDPIISGVPENAVNGPEVSLQPNPAKNYLEVIIKSKGGAELQYPYIVNVYDITGKQLIREQSRGSTKLNIQQLQSGIYIVEVMDKYGNAKRKKLIKD